MQYSILIILLILTLMIFSVSINDAFAERVPVDLYDTLKLRHDTNPTICIFEANPEITDNWDQLLLMTVSGINEWRLNLNHAYPSGDWHMPIKQVIPWDEHAEKSADEFRYCNIMFNFEKSSGDNSLGNTGLNFNKSYHKYMFINIFLETQRNAIVINLGDNPIVESNPVKEMPMNTIKNIVVHELGHALGLGHYFIGTPILDNEKALGVDRSVMIPSINPFDNNQSLQITKLDLLMLGKIYGSDGWLNVNPVYFPKECYILNTNIHSCD